MIKILKKLLKDINDGEYDEWAKGYIQDINAPNEIRENDMVLDEVLNPVIDFLHCRIIELEQKEK